MPADDSMMAAWGWGWGWGLLQRTEGGCWTQTKKTKQAWRSHSTQWRGGVVRVVVGMGGVDTLSTAGNPLCPVSPPSAPPTSSLSIGRPLFVFPPDNAGDHASTCEKWKRHFCSVNTMKWDCNGDNQREEGNARASVRACVLRAICRDRKRVLLDLQRSTRMDQHSRLASQGFVRAESH